MDDNAYKKNISPWVYAPIKKTTTLTDIDNDGRQVFLDTPTYKVTGGSCGICKKSRNIYRNNKEQ